MLTLTFLGQTYTANFPQELATKLSQFSDEEKITMGPDAYSQYCEELEAVACDCLEWDESEDNVISPMWDEIVQLITEGQTIDHLA